MVYGASISYEIGGGIPHEYFDLHTPLGIAYPLALVKKTYPNIELKIIDQAVHLSSNERLLDLIKKEEFDLVGFSSYVWNSMSVMHWIRELKKDQNDIKIVVGGPQFTYIPKLVMKRLSNLDFLIKKEGEIPFLKLVEKLRENDQDYRDVPNLIYRQNNEINENSIEMPPLNLDEYSSPYLTGVLDEYLKGNCKYIGLQTSRGCPFNCAYCVWNIQSTFKGFPKIRYFSINRIIEELKYIKKRIKGDYTIEIYDATFNENQKRLVDLCQKLKKNRLNLRFGVRLRADLLNDKQINILKSMGVGIIRVGIESVGKSLKAVKRSQSQEKINSNLLKTIKAGIYVSGNIMIGLPNQTSEEVIETIKLVKSLNINVFTVNVYDPPTGTEIYNHPEKFGMKEFNKTEDGRKFFENSLINRKQLIELAKFGNKELNSMINDLLKKYKGLVAFS